MRGLKGALATVHREAPGHDRSSEVSGDPAGPDVPLSTGASPNRDGEVELSLSRSAILIRLETERPSWSASSLISRANFGETQDWITVPVFFDSAINNLR